MAFVSTRLHVLLDSCLPDVFFTGSIDTSLIIVISILNRSSDDVILGHLTTTNSYRRKEGLRLSIFPSNIGNWKMALY